MYKTSVFWLLLFPMCIIGQVDFQAYAVHKQSGVVVSTSGADFELVPASIWKTVTLGCALNKLGPEYKYSTTLYTTGEIDRAGHLQGNLVVAATGDPSLGSRRYESSLQDICSEVVGLLQSEGITCVEGDILIDHQAWGEDVISPHWLWEDIGNYYACGAWGFNIHDNLVQLSFEKATERPNLVSIVPEAPNCSWINELGFGKAGSGDQAYVYGVPKMNTRFVRGTLPIDMSKMTIKASMPDPEAVFRHALINSLARANISVKSISIEWRTSDQRLLHRWESPPMSTLVETALLHSDNLYVEAIVRTAIGGRSYKAFLENLSMALRELGQGSFAVSDACGLSPYNKVSVKSMVEFLEVFRSIKTYMPKAGATSISRFLSPKTRENVFIKSGYTSQTVSYAGYDDQWTFAMIYNGTRHRPSKVRKAMAQWLEAEVLKVK